MFYIKNMGVEMSNIIGVKFKKTCKVYYFDKKDYSLQKGDFVLVQTAKGMEFGEVIVLDVIINEKTFNKPIIEIERKADFHDLIRKEENVLLEKKAINICKEQIKNLKLDMTLVDCEFTFDRSKLTFYFTSDTRVDFRNLVKKLASIFKNRIELRQISAREKAKIMGGIGVCGQVCCCHRFLSDFQPVSVKMAKTQNLTLNPSKISGTCGRLMCCLNYEQETYEKNLDLLPKIGQKVKTSDGLGYVIDNNLVNCTTKVRVQIDEEEFENIYKYYEVEIICQEAN